MHIVLVRNWWSLVLRGLVAVLIGIVTFIWPGITLTALVLLFGAYALIDGVLSLAGAVRAAEAHERWGVLVLEGIAGILAALVTLFWPAITALVLVYIIAVWAIITGIAEISAAVRLRKHVSGEWVLGALGVASLLFGILIALVPVAGALVITFWFGAYAIIFGALLLALGFRLRHWGRTPHARTSIPLPAH